MRMCDLKIYKFSLCKNYNELLRSVRLFTTNNVCFGFIRYVRYIRLVEANEYNECLKSPLQI